VGWFIVVAQLPTIIAPMSKRTDLIRCLPNLAIDQRSLSLCRCPDPPYAVKHCQASGKTFVVPKRIAGQVYCFWTTVSSRLFRGQANGPKIIRPLKYAA